MHIAQCTFNYAHCTLDIESNYKKLACLRVCASVDKIQNFQSQFQSEARNRVSEASMPPAGARIFKGPEGPLKFQYFKILPAW